MRVLHLGNIANNAYNNAKLLRAAGVDSDVLCPFYYHTMACPEWEDADFEGELDDFRPAWHRVDLNGFVRPAWFSQGPPALAVRYLLARRRGEKAKAWGYRRLLALTLRIRSGRLGEGYQWIRGVWGQRVSPRHVAQLPASELARFGLASLAQACVNLLSVVLSLVGLASKALPRRSRETDVQGGGSGGGLGLRALVAAFAERFPDRADKLDEAELAPLARDAAFYAELFSHYDVVQAYATDPIYPLLAGKHPYVAFEHGTLREIPWEATTRGRCTSLSYALADHVLVTNPDCTDSAVRLNPGRVTVINHPWDEDHARGVEGADALRAELLAKLEADHLVFFPTRHDWVPGTGYADKANDRFFRALARWTSAHGVRVGVVCCEWGANVEQSRALLEELELGRYISWSAPMGTVRFERHVLASDLVADQFDISGMGGIAFKALSAGRPVLMRIEESVMLEKYGEVPPVFNCSTEEEISTGLDFLLEPKEARERYYEAARAWVKKHHSGRETVEKQLAIYETLTEARPAPEALS